MLLRRLSHHVRTQNWFAIGLDFLIVVVGVFLGFQITVWNELRQDAQRGERFLERIYEDLGSDLEGMDYAISYWQKVVDYGAAAIAYTEHGRLSEDSAWETVLAFYQAGQFIPYVTNGTTYLEMRSAGDLGLIDSEALREALAVYYVNGIETAPHLMRTPPQYRDDIRGLTPFDIQSYVWANCVNNEGRREVLLDCSSPVSEGFASSILDAYKANPAVIGGLRTWAANQLVALKAIKNNRNRCVALREQVASELGIQ